MRWFLKFIFAGNCAALAAALMLLRVPRETSRTRGAAGHSHLRQPAYLAIAAAGSLIQASHAVYYGFSVLDWRAMRQRSNSYWVASVLCAIHGTWRKAVNGGRTRIERQGEKPKSGGVSNL